ncbi:VOC family protein [Hyphococcus lacteus]|uniref:VOC family protein n=1 Tax=Hyphococcus lacteus TaxID=3143536 RepID=A0ABV3YZS9_9PROT
MKNCPIKIKQLDHVVLKTRNMERSLEFYCQTLGCTIERTVPTALLVQLRAGVCLIDLLDVSDGNERHSNAQEQNMDHFCLTLDDWDEKAIRKFLIERGHSMSETVLRYGAEGMGPSIYIKDPDGNQIELKKSVIDTAKDGGK